MLLLCKNTVVLVHSKAGKTGPQSSLHLYTNTLSTTSFFFRPKHPVKVHVWAGISMGGRTGICIFDGIMDAEMYITILRGALLPFIKREIRV